MRSVSLAIALSLVAGPALADMPAISSAWSDLTINQEACYSLADSVLRKTNHRRIERIGTSTFGDTADGQTQVVIRCAVEKNIVIYIVAGGRGSDKVTQPLVTSLKSEFERSMAGRN